jgi:hypothetical protein
MHLATSKLQINESKIFIMLCKTYFFLYFHNNYESKISTEIKIECELCNVNECKKWNNFLFIFNI